MDSGKIKSEYLYIILLFVIIFACPIVEALQSTKKPEIKTILYIDSSLNESDWAESFQAGMLSVLKRHSSFSITNDSIAPQRSERLSGSTLEYFKKRYKDKNIDLIIVSKPYALELGLYLRKEMYPDIPIIYSSTSSAAKNLVLEEKNIYEVIGCDCLAKTINLAMKLQPYAKDIYFITDKTPIGDVLLKRVKKLQSLYKDKIKFNFLDNLSVHTIPMRLPQIPANSIVMYLNFTQDQRGEILTLRNSIKLITKNLKAPLYCTRGFDAGLGAVGGIITDEYQHGRIAAGLAEKLLTGQKTSQIPQTTTFTSPVKIDYQALIKHNLNPEFLPPACIVVNRPNTFKELCSLHKIPFTIMVIIIISFLAASLVLPYYIKKTRVESTLRNKISHALEQSNAYFEMIFKNAPVGITRIKTMENTIVDANETFCEVFGYSRHEVTKLKFTELFHPGNIPGETDYLSEITSGKRSEYILEKLITNKNGKKIWIKMTICPMWKRGERPDYLVAIFQDTSNIRDKDEKLEKYRNELEMRVESRTQDLNMANFELQTILNSVRAAIFYKDTNGNYIKVNRAAADMTGLPIHEIEGKSAKVVFPDYYRMFADNDNEVIRTGKPKIGIEGKIHSAGGEIRWMLTDIYPTYDSIGNISGVIVLCFDITTEKESEKKLEERYKEMVILNRAMVNLVDDIDIAKNEILKSQQQLKLANEELRSFSYSVSHDLRAPLRALDGFSEVILQDYHDKLDEDGRDALMRIRNASTNMGVLIDSLLRLSRISQSTLMPVNVNLSSIAEDICDDLSNQSPERNVKIKIMPDLKAYGDANLLQVVLTNLLGNAWKFTRNVENAEIELGCENNSDGTIVYYVKDNGAGFDMNYADKLFGAFQRLHSKDIFEGNGIGLATVKRIIRRHNGAVWAESEIDKGATFYFTLGNNSTTKGDKDESP